MWNDQSKKRLERLKGLLQQLDDGKNVAPRDLKQWLSKEQIEAYETEVLQIRDFDAMWQERPSEFDGYLALLKKADFAHSKGDKISAKASLSKTKVFPSASSLINNSQTYFEQAIEKLQEILEKCPELVVWLDRAIDFTHGNEPGIDPVSIPRLRTSKAHHAEDTYKSTKRQQFHNAKRRAVVDAIEEIEKPQPVIQSAKPDESVAEQLQRLRNLTGR